MVGWDLQAIVIIVYGPLSNGAFTKYSLKVYLTYPATSIAQIVEKYKATPLYHSANQQYVL